MTRAAIRGLAVAALLLSAAPLAQEPGKPMWGGSIRGRVVAADTGLPLAGARVSIRSLALTSTDLPPFSENATATADGSFEFQDIPGGTFAVLAVRPGYVVTASSMVLLRDRDTAAVTIAMNRGGTINGRITGQFGEPVSNIQVHALRHSFAEDGTRQRVPSGTADVTDDLGEFRLYGLPPGDYAVVASGRDGADGPFGFLTPFAFAETAPTYYPGTADAAEAQTVTVGLGSDASVQFALLSRRTVRLSGRVIRADGSPATGARLMLWSAFGTLDVGAPATLAPDGTFTLAGVPPGQYWLNARDPGRLGAGAETASALVTVADQDVGGLSLVTTGGATLRGRVVYEGRRPDDVRIAVAPVDRTGPFGGAGFGFIDEVRDDGRFEAKGIIGRVIFSAMDASTMVKAVTGGGPNALDGGLDLDGRSEVNGLVITVTDKIPEVAGRVIDADGRGLGEQFVVLERVGPRLPRNLGSRVVRTDAAGRFGARGLRPGPYVAAALDDLAQNEQFSPEFQERLRERGERFTLGDGERHSLELMLTPGLR